jgi:hypothetical protein
MFGAANLWTASVSNAYQVGVKARFADPVWKSVSEGQQAILARTAYFPLRSGTSRIIVRQDGYSRDGHIQFKIQVENPLEGWTYHYEGEEKGIMTIGTPFWGRISSTQLSPTEPEIYRTPFDSSMYDRACVRLVLTMKKGGSLVNSEVRNFPIKF